MSRTHIALAIALAVSLGVTKPTLSPIREVPLSKSDILVADNTSDQGSAKMGKGSASIIRMVRRSTRTANPIR